MQAPYRDEMCRIRASAGPKTTQLDAGVLSADSVSEALDPTPELRDAVAKALANLTRKTDAD